MGNYWMRSSHHLQALPCYTAALKTEKYMNPGKDRALVLRNRSYCYKEISQFKDAINDAEEALSMEPSKCDNHWRRVDALRGLAKAAAGEPEEYEVLAAARDAVIEAIAMLPEAERGSKNWKWLNDMSPYERLKSMGPDQTPPPAQQQVRKNSVPPLTTSTPAAMAETERQRLAYEDDERARVAEMEDEERRRQSQIASERKDDQEMEMRRRMQLEQQQRDTERKKQQAQLAGISKRMPVSPHHRFQSRGAAPESRRPLA